MRRSDELDLIPETGLVPDTNSRSHLSLEKLSNIEGWAVWQQPWWVRQTEGSHGQAKSLEILARMRRRRKPFVPPCWLCRKSIRSGRRSRCLLSV